MHTQKIAIEELMLAIPEPAKASGVELRQHAVFNAHGQCIGAAVIWAYGSVSAFHTAAGFAQQLYEALPEAAQELLDSGESLIGAALAEAKRVRLDGKRT